MFLTLSSALLPFFLASSQVSAPPAAATFQAQYDPNKQPGAANYDETLANFIYPVGKGPLSQGYPVEPLPVLLMVRGGNSNHFGVGELEFDTQTLAAPSGNMIGVSFNFPIVTPDADYRKSAAGVALLIQYVRANAVAFNVDPDRVILVGRSFGTVLAYAIAFKENYRVPGSTDPVLSQSSRPDYAVPRFGPSQLTCFGEDIAAWAPTMSLFFFPNKTFSEATDAERVYESPCWWILNPEVFGREATPPTCVVYNKTYTDVCSQNIDVHSGMFGDLSLSALRDYADQTGDHELLTKCSSIDQDVFIDPAVAIVVWVITRLAEDGNGLWMLPPAGSVDPQNGGNLTLTCHAAVPGGTVKFYRGTVASPFPLPGCPGKFGELLDFQEIGSAVANAVGVVSTSVFVSGSKWGTIDLLHAADFGNCETSQVQVHKYY